MKDKIRRLKNHVVLHRGAYSSIATSIVLGYFITKRAEEWNAFLEEHGLMDEFYGPLED